LVDRVAAVVEPGCDFPVKNFPGQGCPTDFNVVDGKLVSVVAPSVPNATGTGTIQPALTLGYGGNLLTQVTAPMNHTLTFEYDANSRLTGQTNFDGGYYSYNAMFARPLLASLNFLNAPPALDNQFLS
jgi:YD repeat-containing protein